MIYELPHEDYSKVKKIFAEQKNHPVINGVIQRNNRGKIYVDNLTDPHTALIWAVNEMFYLGGSPDNDNFNTSLNSFLFDTIAPEALELGDSFFQLEVFPKGQWENKLENLLRDKLPKIYHRWSFTFNKESYMSSAGHNYRLPEGYQLKKIDKNLLIDEADKVLTNKILAHWYSVEEFLQKGAGYCVMQDDKVITLCLSVYASTENMEIGIHTFGRRHRGKGLATTAAKALIDYCISVGITPHWTTENFRFASRAVALRLGFENQVEFPCYLILYNEVDNLIFSAYFALKYKKAISLGEGYFEKAKSLGTLAPWHYFYMACGYAEAGLTYSAVKYLDTAISKGWTDVDDVIFDNDLKSLHGSREWQSLMEKLEGKLGYQID